MTKTAVILELNRMKRRLSGWQGVADALGVSQSYIVSVIMNRRQPGTKMLKAMNLERVVSYRRLPK